VLVAVSQQGQDFDRPVLDDRGEVFDGHGCQGRLAEPGAQLRSGPGRVADHQPCHGRDPYQWALDSAGPLRRVWAGGEADEC
jgi:hypothetical protein